MRVLFVSSARKGKGISPFVKAQGESLKKKGLDIQYTTLLGMGLKYYIKSIFHIRKEIRRVKPDILHAHFGLSGIVARLASFRTPLVVSFLGDDLEGTINSKGEYSRKSKFMVSINCFFARYFFDYNIAKSASLAEKLGQIENLSIIPNGVDLKRFKPMSKVKSRELLGIDKNERIILFPSSPLRPVKNYALFKDVKDSLEGGYSELRLENLDPAEVVLYYAASDVTLLTSFHEGSPNVIKEAMACNALVVSANVGDVEEIIGDTQGCCVCAHDSRLMVEAINKLLVATQENEGRSDGRDRIKNLGLSDARIAEKIISVYNKII